MSSSELLESYRVLVTGSRDWQNSGLVHLALDYAYFEALEFGKRLVLVEGECPTGADRDSVEWCEVAFRLGFVVDLDPYPADWKRFGRAAGYIRNADMVNAGADLCLAFIRNNSNGSTHTADYAEKSGIQTLIFREDN